MPGGGEKERVTWPGSPWGGTFCFGLYVLQLDKRRKIIREVELGSLKVK